MVKLARLALLGMLATVSGCELGSTEVPHTAPLLVVHSVVELGRRVHIVLVEESLTGRVAVVDSGPYNPGLPIVSGNGVPVGDALIEMTAADGSVARVTELRQTNGQPTGMYRVEFEGHPAQPGERYTLSVSHNGRTVTGTTIVPSQPPEASLAAQTFNRDRDTVRITIPQLSLARAYWVRIEAPVSPFNLFTLDLDVALTGETRNIFTENLLRLFTPGFEQRLTLAAMDSNLYDYYRTGTDPFTGAGLINRLEGGIGVFGSIARIDHRVINVTQDPTGDPIEGVYTRRAGTPGMPTAIRLYLESNGPTAESPDRISGNYLRAGPNPTRSGVYGTRTGTDFDFAFLDEYRTGQVTSYFRGTIRGDTLRGSFTSSGQALFVKVP